MQGAKKWKHPTWAEEMGVWLERDNEGRLQMTECQEIDR
jgi:hypothetical protein